MPPAACPPTRRPSSGPTLFRVSRAETGAQMGCTLTKDARVSEKEVRLKEGEEPLLMRLGHAEHLPSLDVGSESDVFVVMDLLDAHGHVVASAKWPVKWDNNHPVWNSCRPLGTAPVSYTHLTLPTIPLV